MLSIVVPIHNEEPAILPLYDQLTRVLDGGETLRDHLCGRRLDRPEFRAIGEPG